MGEAPLDSSSSSLEDEASDNLEQYAFEEEMRTFLTSMGCEMVNGGPNFNIAPSGQKNQIDACGKYGKILFIVECTAAKRRQSKPTDLRKKIMETFTKMSIAEQNYKNIKEYADCDKIVPIFATKKYKITSDNEQLLSQGLEGHKIYHINEDFIEYYRDLIDKIGHYATFSILSEFGIHPPQDEKLVVDAIEAKIKGYNCYLFYANPKELLKFTYVARRYHPDERFYQRALDKSRLSSIRKFIATWGKFFPTNIVISLKGNNRYYFRPNNRVITTSQSIELGQLEIRNSYAACWIIDGQHRLYSFAKADIEFPVPCLAIEGLSFEKERDFFVDINKEQKAVSSDLIWDLEGEKDPECNTDEGLVSNIVKELDNGDSKLWRIAEEASPFIGRIDMPSSKKESPLLKLSAFCNGIVNAGLVDKSLPDAIVKLNPRGNPMLAVEKGTIARDRVAKTIAKYFNMLIEKFQDDDPFHQELKEFFLGNAGVPILLYVLEPIVARIGKAVPNREELRTYTDPIISYFNDTLPHDPNEIKKLKKHVSGEGARRDMAYDIGKFIKERVRDTNFWPSLGNSEIIVEIQKIERALGDFIADKLESIDPNWEKHRLPQGMLDQLEKQMNPNDNLQDLFSIWHEKDIIMRSDNWDAIFNELLTENGVFQDKKEFEVACDTLSRNRGPRAHTRSVDGVSADLQTCKAYINKFKIILSDYLTESDQQ